MRNIVSFPMISVEVNREEIPVEMMSPEQVPDEKWRYVDKKGHGHFWEGEKLPTLEWVVTGTKWVGDEYDASEIEVGEHRCKQCAEVVKPKRRAECGPSHIPGPMIITVIIDGETFRLDLEQYAKSVESWAVALRCLKSEEAQ